MGGDFCLNVSNEIYKPLGFDAAVKAGKFIGTFP